jgi:hypothetical protein
VRFGRRTLGGDTGQARCDQDGDDVSNQLNPLSPYLLAMKILPEKIPPEKIPPKKILPKKIAPDAEREPRLKADRRSCARTVSHNQPLARVPNPLCARRLGGVAWVERAIRQSADRSESQLHLRLWQGLRSGGTAIHHSGRTESRLLRRQADKLCLNPPIRVPGGFSRGDVAERLPFGRRNA